MSLIADLKSRLQRQRRMVFALLLLPILLASTRASLDPAHALAGRYYRQFPDGTIDGDKYTGEDIVEIVPIGQGAAYVRIYLDYFNGHSCDISGVAKSQANSLVYQDPEPHYRGKMCVLRIKRQGNSLSVDDGDSSCDWYCGARGTLTDVKLPYSSKRPIGYLPRLRSSPEYREALKAWTEKK
jgi:hypothetical protein